MHWRYFLALERDLETCARYVELSPDNRSTYSLEFAKLLLSVGSETDVVLKSLCGQVAPPSPANNINDYRRIILSKYPRFPDLRVRILGTPIELAPWNAWSGGTNPLWWSSYNGVKHDRAKQFKAASLENVLNAFAGLLVAVLYEIHAKSPGMQPEVMVEKESILFDTENQGAWDGPHSLTGYAILI